MSAEPGFEGVGVVVLTHGRGGEHTALLESLLAEGVPAGSIVLVHNPTEAGSPRRLFRPAARSCRPSATSATPPE